MNYDDFAEVLIVFDVPPTLEDEMIDWLLQRPSSAGFSSMRISGHSASHAHLSAAEQVSGRERRLQFSVHLSTSALDELVRNAKAQFGSADVHYWVTPVLSHGRLNSQT